MDDMLGAMLDIDDSVRIIMDWIEENGGYEKNALVRIQRVKHRFSSF
jgi:hypothetical protein